MPTKPILRYFLLAEELKIIDDEEGSRLAIIDPLTDIMVESPLPVEIEFYMATCISNLEENKKYTVMVKVCLPNGKELEIYYGGFKTNLKPTLTYYTVKPIKLEIIELGTYEFFFYLNGEMLENRIVQMQEWVDTIL